ncbi:MAG: hypothetical protein PW843_11155 [Azospirillaceae bacterium]|nr:hypothetical protein [Azospirillaceae bacterium]
MNRAIVGIMALAIGLAAGTARAQDATTTSAPPPQAPTPATPPRATSTTPEDPELAAAAIRNMREEKWREAARAYQATLGPDAPPGASGLCCHPTPYGTEWCH